MVNNGYAGILAWHYSCEPQNDEACMRQPVIADGIRAAANASEYARTLTAEALGYPSMPLTECLACLPAATCQAYL